MSYRLVIEREGRRPQVFRLIQAATIIGRGKDTDLLLPDISVSRHHAQVERRDDGMVIVDLDSQNGTKVNGQRVKEHPLEPGDEVQVGKFVLTFEFKPARKVEEAPRASDDMTGYHLENERPGFLQQVSAVDDEHAHSTTQLTPEKLEELRKLARLQESARLTHPGGQEWLIGEKGVQFGNGGLDPGGLGLGGAALVTWQGKAHAVQKQGGLFFKIKVNGKEVKETCALEPGDTLEIGKGVFTYTV